MVLSYVIILFYFGCSFVFVLKNLKEFYSGFLLLVCFSVSCDGQVPNIFWGNKTHGTSIGSLESLVCWPFC